MLRSVNSYFLLWFFEKCTVDYIYLWVGSKISGTPTLQLRVSYFSNQPPSFWLYLQAWGEPQTILHENVRSQRSMMSILDELQLKAKRGFIDHCFELRMKSLVYLTINHTRFIMTCRQPTCTTFTARKNASSGGH